VHNKSYARRDILLRSRSRRMRDGDGPRTVEDQPPNLPATLASPRRAGPDPCRVSEHPPERLPCPYRLSPVLDGLWLCRLRHCGHRHYQRVRARRRHNPDVGIMKLASLDHRVVEHLRTAGAAP
jgi:hypothetical protein